MSSHPTRRLTGRYVLTTQDAYTGPVVLAPGVRRVETRTVGGSFATVIDRLIAPESR